MAHTIITTDLIARFSFPAAAKYDQHIAFCCDNQTFLSEHRYYDRMLMSC